MIFIFDLDGTVIDTSHRYRDKPDGMIDLDYWFANSTPEMIARDTLLPLADVWRRYHAEGHTIVVCTARTMVPHPSIPMPDPGAVYRQYLADNGLHYHALLTRCMYPGDFEGVADATLKTHLLNAWAEREGLPSDWRRDAIMWDDNVTVIRKMIADRLWTFDARNYNAKLANGTF